MNEKTKSLIRHAITAIGTVIALLGLNKYLPIIDLVQESFDGVWGAVELIVGFVVAILGFFKDKDRHEVRAAAK